MKINAWRILGVVCSLFGGVYGCMGLFTVAQGYLLMFFSVVCGCLRLFVVVGVVWRLIGVVCCCLGFLRLFGVVWRF